jgi:single-strand DNA-binding protein
MLVGHLGKDPELRYLENHIAVASFPLATTELVMKSGVQVEHTEWHHIIMWRTIAELAFKTLKKGELVWVEGRIKTRSFEDKSGLKKRLTEIVIENFRHLGKSADIDNAPDNIQPGMPPPVTRQLPLKETIL